MSATLKPVQRPMGILAPSDRERLRNKIRDLESRMKGKVTVQKNAAIKEQGFTRKRQGYLEQFMRDDVREDPALLKRQLDHAKHVLSAGSPHEITREQRVQLEKQVSEDREFLKKNLTSKALFYMKGNDPSFETAKRAVMRESTPDFQRVSDRYVQSLRALDPDNVDRNHIEKLRPS